MLLADDAALRDIEEALEIAERSGEDLALGFARLTLGVALVHRDSPAERERGLAVLGQVRDMCLQGRFYLSDLLGPSTSTPRGRGPRAETAMSAIPLMRAAIDEMFDAGQLAHCDVRRRAFWWRRCLTVVPTVTSSKPRPRSRGWRLRQPTTGLVIREVWLLRMRALLAQAHGDESRLPRLSGSLPRDGDIAWLRGAHGVGRGDAMTAAAPSGVVTFLFTDVEGSTRRWEADADGMRAALAAHDEVLRSSIEGHGGLVVQAHRRRGVRRIRFAEIRGGCGGGCAAGAGVAGADGAGDRRSRAERGLITSERCSTAPRG